MSASFTAAAPAKRRWFPMGKKASSGPVLTPGDGGAQPSEARAASATPAPYVDSVVGGGSVAGGDNGVVNTCGGGVDIEAPEWTTTTTTTSDGDGGDGPGERRCQLHRTLMSLRDVISDALARETEGLPQSREEKEATAVYTMPTNGGAKTRARGAGENGKSGQGSGDGGSTVNGVAKEPETEEAEQPAAAEMALLGVHDALDVPSEVRRNISLGKIFGATPSPGNTEDHDPVAAAAAAAAAAKEAMRTQATTTSGASHASATKGGGTKGVNGERARKQ